MAKNLLMHIVNLLSPFPAGSFYVPHFRIWTSMYDAGRRFETVTVGQAQSPLEKSTHSTFCTLYEKNVSKSKRSQFKIYSVYMFPFFVYVQCLLSE